MPVGRQSVQSSEELKDKQNLHNLKNTAESVVRHKGLTSRLRILQVKDINVFRNMTIIVIASSS